ncbi:hypothetical protein [Paractinoplanes atraurantiacus]|uniref:Tetratricopeptide repeat-containing protein n=1 Tax=Paractinoplanes atraurantiacus TaxID=1036182 RepID=A0A285HPA3_9ACTN|nr:hypothetical protein [Actinoplanes atraurantiacus]SNY37590.1 Tetratricopeptide repeat-containing protein [Actinoplanes atraurantiacus]
MAENRRGRREGALDAAQPTHRRDFAARLRALREECGRPTYRELSKLAHTSYNSLSEAASGRRLPTWPTTRGYVTACLHHTGRAADVERLLPRWRRAWEDADILERAERLEAPAAVPPDAAAPTSRPRPLLRPLVALLSVVVLMATMAAAGVSERGPAPMNGLYNILVAPFEGVPGLQQTVLRDLRDWAAADSGIGVREVAARPPAPGLGGLAAAHGADVVLSGRAGDDGMVVDLLLTERVFAETPEFAGHHELRLTEPADLVRGNIVAGRRLADDAVRYVKAVVAFVRGLGHYALDDFPRAEQEFRAADRELGTAPHAEMILLMLGNTQGRQGRYAEAATTFRRALKVAPGHARATIGLAESLRAESGCRRAPLLREALGLYRAALPAGDTTLLRMKTHLGLGLTYQCLGDTRADGEFATVLRLHEDGRLSAEAGRQSLRLAAEARAGQALPAPLTAVATRSTTGPFAVRPHELTEAARAYEEALALLDRIDVDRPALRERKLVFLRNLREVYEATGATTETRTVDERIRQTETAR